MSKGNEIQGRRQYTIGILIGNATSPHTMDMMKGIYHAAKEINVNVLYFLGMHSRYFYTHLLGDDTENDYDYQFNTVYDYALLGKVDALIISYGSICIFWRDLDKQAFLDRFSDIPRVLLEDREETETPSYIISDNYGGMYDCIEHLIVGHGYRKILYLSGPKDNRDSLERYQAYLDIMKKYGLPISDDMVEFGDYSEYIKRQAEHLLDLNPDAEALVCANDQMAAGVYEVCESRGIRVGKDLAVTGYDNYEITKSMDPPLTTVTQNAYDMGYMALQNAMELCTGGRKYGILMPGNLVRRSSCGCKSETSSGMLLTQKLTQDNAETYALSLTEKIVSEIIMTDSNEQIRVHIRETIYAYVETIMKASLNDNRINFDKQHIQNLLRSLFRGEYGKYISANALTRCLSDLFEAIIQISQSPDLHTFFMSLLKESQIYVQAHVLREGKLAMDEFQYDLWFMPLIVRDMINDSTDLKTMFYDVLVKLRAIKTTKAYIYLLEKPVEHTQQEEWKCPDKMYLAGYFEGENVVAYRENERPCVNRENGFMSMVQDQGHSCMFCYNIFAAKRHYGILIGETRPEDMSLMYCASMQIGAALRYVEISQMQRKTQNKLERSLQEIEDKNEVLNFLSEYDELTGCLNRRGFVERAITMNKVHSGETAVLFFGDLDHLKEINDSFGHVEGDYAIIAIGKLLEKAYEGESIVGRIGGDEFVMMFIGKEPDAAERVMKGITEQYRILNETSDKPYYIEASIGYKEFICKPDFMLKEVLNQADETLYEAKKLRRSTIKK